MENVRELTPEMKESYARKNPGRGPKVLSIMGKNQQFINAMSTPIGLEFMRRLIARTEDNRNALDNMDIDQSDKKFAEARARYNESFTIMQMFLEVLDMQEKLYKEVVEKS